MTNVVVNNSTLTNNGSIIIGGIINGGGGTFTSGYSTGKYTQITLNSSTIENNGSITAYGYIDESGSGSKINNNSTGSISAPFVVVENRGGTTYSLIYNLGNMHCSPFNTFYMPNIYPTIRTESGGAIYGLADLYANSQHNRTSINLIGNNDSYLLNMGVDTVIETDYNGIMHIDIYGSVSLNSLSIAFNASGMDINISTSSVYFPISYYYDIRLHKFEDNSLSKVLFNNQDIKLLPGARLLIDDGVTVEASKIIVYGEDFVDVGHNSVAYPVSERAQLIVDGELEVKELGGYITTTGSTGKLTVTTSSTVSSKEVKSNNPFDLCNTWTYKLKLILNNNGVLDTSPTDCDFGTYESENGGWIKIASGSGEEGGGSGGGTCLVEGTLITMADGTKKKVEDVVPGDMLLIFNHETGKYDVAPVLFNDSEEISNYTVINLVFSDGTIVKVVSEHGFFDLDLMKYVYIDEINHRDFIGHQFYYSDIINNSIVNGKVTLVDSYITTEYTRVYSPVTKYHLNYFTNNLLSMPGGIDGLFNIFEYDENLKYDEEKKQNDIETYGLYTYEDFKDLVSYEIYESFPANYFAVAIGKGLLTWDDIYYYIERYTPLM